MEERRHKNFIMIKNKMWEAFYNKPLPEQEKRVFDYIFRMTIGWGCKMKELSTYIIAKDLDILDVNVRRAIRALKRKKRIIVKGKSKGIQKDYTLWKIEQIRSTKKIEQIRSNTRANTLVSLEQDCSLIKDTLKDKKKEKVLSKPKEGERKERLIGSVQSMIESIGNMPGMKKTNTHLTGRNQNKEK